jgi:hypothetical protein
MNTRSLLSLAGLLCAGPLAHGQIAITEVMSSAANTFQGAPATQQSDFFELTNFGTTPVSLDGYKWTDNNSWDPAVADASPFVGVTIQPGESLIVMFTDVTQSEAAFRAWWGAPAANVRVLNHNHRGFGSGGDEVRLWDASNNLVDAVVYGAATRGRTFVYSPANGTFGVISALGVGGAYAAATADDVGSPGLTTGPVPLVITQQPTNVTVGAGSPFALSVAASGLPKPRYQWYRNSAALPGATTNVFTLTNAQVADGGGYFAVLNNGIEAVTSVVAQVTVNPAPSAPQVTLAPVSQSAYKWQNVTFTAAAIGNPAPQYQWRHNGVDLPFETNPSLTLYAVSTASSGTYTVVISNSAGTTNVSAQLAVTTKPRLVITEVMSSEGTNTAGVVVGMDYWELTNLDTFEVNLRGWRWDDDESLAGAFVVPNDVILRPGQSAIFVEAMTPEAFRAWWGPANLSPELKVITFTGNGLSSLGDVITLWNSAATDDGDRVTGLAFASATAGVSFGFNPVTEEFGALSVAGQYGAFHSATGNDLGSPGYLWPRPVILSSQPIGTDFAVTWTSRAGVPYALRAAASLTGPWTTLTNRVATGSTLGARIPLVPGNRFHVVVENP